MNIKNKILSLIDSVDLKEKLVSENHQLTDLDFSYLIYELSDSFTQRIELLQELLPFVSDLKAIKSIKNIISYELKMRENFLRNEDNYIYEITIEDSGFTLDRLLSKTYEGAIKIGQCFFTNVESYGLKESVNTRYIIKKKRVFDFENLDDFFDSSEIGIAIFNQDMVLHKVDYYNVSNNFNEENNYLLHHEISFPKFLDDGDLVYFKDEYGNLIYGISLGNKYHDANHTAYIILLENELINNKDIGKKSADGYEIFDYHEHVFYPLVSKANLSTITKKINEKYTYALDFFKKIKEI